MALLERLAILITADAAGALNEMKKVAAGAEKDLGKAGTEGSKLAGNMTKVGAGMVAAGAGLLAVGVASADTATSLGREVMKLQRYTGMTAEEASKLAFAAKMSGVPVDSLATGLGKLSKAMEANSPVFDKLGVSARDSDGKLRSMGDVLPDLAEKFKNMPNGPEKTATALQLFGRAGMDLMPFLNKGKDGIKQLSDEAEKMGLVLSQDNVGQIKEHIQSQRDLNAALDGVKTKIGLQMIPILDGFTKAFTQLPGPIQDVIGPITVFGGGALVAMGAIGMLVGQLQNLGPAFAAVKLFISGADPLTLALMAVGAAVAIAAVAIAAFGDNAKNDKNNVDAFTRALEETGIAANKLTADQIALKLHNDGLSDAFRNTGISAEVLNAAVQSGDKNFKTYGDALGTNAFMTDKVQAAIKNASPEVVTFNEAVKQAARDGKITDAQLDSLTKTTGQLAFDFGTAKDSSADLTTTSEALRGTATDLATAEQAAADATNNHTAAGKALNDALHGALDPFFGMISAATGNAKAQADAADAADKVKIAYDQLQTALAGGNEKDVAEKTKAMSDATNTYESSQRSAADSAVTYQTSLTTLTDKIKDGSITSADAIRKIDEMQQKNLISAGTADYFRGKIGELNTAIGAIPPIVGVTVTANTGQIDEAIQKIFALNRAAHTPTAYNFSSLPGYSGSMTGNPTPGVDLSFLNNAMGGRIGPGMAMGGRPGKPILTGELGPEIFWPDSAGTIVTAEKTRQMLSSSGGGGTAVYNINVNVAATADKAAIGKTIVESIAAYERRSGQGWRA